MGSNLLSTDLLVSLYLNPLVKAYQFHDVDVACTLLYSFLRFFASFGYEVKNVPEPINPDQTDIADRRYTSTYYTRYFKKYYPVMSALLGKYQRDVLDAIKEEAGHT